MRKYKPPSLESEENMKQKVLTKRESEVFNLLIKNKFNLYKYKFYLKIYNKKSNY